MKELGDMQISMKDLKVKLRHSLRETINAKSACNVVVTIALNESSVGIFIKVKLYTNHETGDNDYLSLFRQQTYFGMTMNILREWIFPTSLVPGENFCKNCSDNNPCKHAIVCQNWTNTGPVLACSGMFTAMVSYIIVSHLGPLLLTWFNTNHNMDK